MGSYHNLSTRDPLGSRHIPFFRCYLIIGFDVNTKFHFPSSQLIYCVPARKYGEWFESLERFSIECRKSSGIALVLLYYAVIGLKTHATCSTNQMQNQNQSRLCHTRFPALGVGYVYLLNLISEIFCQQCLVYRQPECFRALILCKLFALLAWKMEAATVKQISLQLVHKTRAMPCSSQSERFFPSFSRACQPRLPAAHVFFPLRVLIGLLRSLRVARTISHRTSYSEQLPAPWQILYTRVLLG